MSTTPESAATHYYPQPRATPNPLRKRAQRVESIFSLLAILVLIFGGLATVALFLTGASSSNQLAAVFGFGMAVTTGLFWAVLSLGTVLMAYVAEKTADSTVTPTSLLL